MDVEDVAAVAAHDMAEDIFDAEPEAEVMDDDGLPPPAYRPEVPAFQPQADTMADVTETFVAPKAPSPGTPTPETMSRLQAAAQKAPAAPGTRSPAAQQAPQAVPQQAQNDKGRFGFNRLIDRMTGHAADTPAAAAPARQQPQVQPVEPAPHGHHQQPDAEQERIEIPAFLRRQAN